MWLTVVIIYLAVISIASIIATAKDKSSARSGKWRVPEKTLFILSALGGSVAMYITMKAIRHKTRHKRFMIGIPVIIALQVCLIGAIILYRSGIISFS